MLGKIQLTIILVLIGSFVVNTQPTTPNFPCIELVNGLCSKCYPTHTLQQSRCFISVDCPPRKFFRYGRCLDVSPTCGDFDYYTGFCRNCINNHSYVINNLTGNCDRVQVTCGPRQYNINQTCFNVSVTCGNFDVNSGRCIDCISNLYQLNTDGTCTLIILNCAFGQYQNIKMA